MPVRPPPGCSSMIPAPDGVVRASADELGQLVIVRPRVVENADHVLGNLFQRLYHGVERARALDGALADDLAASMHEVEDCLQLLLDYVAPFAPALEAVPVPEILASLRQRVGERLGCDVVSDAGPEGTVMVDPGRLGRAFAQMVLRLVPASASSTPARLTATVQGESVVLTVHLPEVTLAPRTSMNELRWAVADKLIEIHAGALDERAAAGGEVQWNVSLPRGR